MIGNGFDLAHGLHTKYTHFLDFIYVFQGKSAKYTKITARINHAKALSAQKSEKADYFRSLIGNNIWLEYFTKSSSSKETWIGIEADILNVIRLFERVRKEYFEVAKIDIQNIDTPASHKIADHLFKDHSFLKELKFGYRLIGTKDIITYDEYKTKGILRRCFYRRCLSYRVLEQWNACLTDDLNKLIKALEFYLYDYVYTTKVSTESPDILEVIGSDRINISSTRLLSFNYTNTFEKVYSSYPSEIDAHYIHGRVRKELVYSKCDETDKNDDNDMVLGINEYLDDRSDNIDFIAFQKYYQRIQKRTGNTYKTWLHQINREKRFSDLYIFGHSLDITDKDILKELVLNKFITTTVFYYDQAAYNQYIANLVKIIGKDELISRVYSTKPTIIFRQQCNPISKNDVPANSDKNSSHVIV
jgi:hypothetical protein